MLQQTNQLKKITSASLDVCVDALRLGRLDSLYQEVWSFPQVQNIGEKSGGVATMYV